jgi:predicted RNA polymerase sigma factor
VLAYERRSRVFLVHESAWSRHVTEASEAIEHARVGYEAMSAEMEMLGVEI